MIATMRRAAMFAAAWFLSAAAGVSAQPIVADVIARRGDVLVGIEPRPVEFVGTPLLSSDDYLAYPAFWEIGTGRGLVVVQNPGGTRRVVPFGVPIPGHPDLQFDTGVLAEMALFSRGRIALTARRNMVDRVLFVGTPDTLRRAAGELEQAPGMPAGVLWTSAHTLGFLDADDSAIIFGSAREPGGVPRDVIAASKIDGMMELLLRSGVADGSPGSPPESLTRIWTAAVGGSVVSVLAQTSQNQTVVIQIRDGLSRVVYRPGGVLNLEGASLQLGAANLLGVSDQGETLIRVVESSGGSPFAALLAVAADGGRRVIVRRNQPLSADGTQIVDAQGRINSHGFVLMSATLADALGQSERFAVILDRQGMLTVALEAGQPLSTNIGEITFEEFSQPSIFNARGQFIGQFRRPLPGSTLLQQDFLMAWDPLLGWTMLAIQGGALNTTTAGVLPEAIYILANATWTPIADQRPTRLLSDSGRVAFSVFSSLIPHLVTAVIPSPGIGDANADGRVDNADLSVLLSSWGQSVTPGTGADLNRDGAVNATDLSILLTQFNRAAS